MVARRHLIHPKLLRSLPDFYPQAGTVQRLTGAQDTYGQPVDTWEFVSSRLINIPCRVSPVSVSEVDTREQKYGLITHRIALQGAYPEIEEQMRIVVDERAYDIQGVQTDAQGRSTYVNTEIVRSEPEATITITVPTLATESGALIVTDGGVGVWVL